MWNGEKNERESEWNKRMGKKMSEKVSGTKEWGKNERESEWNKRMAKKERKKRMNGTKMSGKKE